MTYEKSMKRLDEIVSKLETGGNDLDSTIKLFEEGAALLKLCREELLLVETKVETIRLENTD